MAQIGQAVSKREKLLRKGGLKPGGKVVVCLAVLVVAAIIGGFVLVGWPFGGGAGDSFEIERTEEAAGAVGETQAAADAAVVAAPQEKIVVHVDGQVAVPGVYELVEGEARVNDAILAAGGLTAEADTSSLNLASKVADGQKIYVPAVGEQQVVTETSGATAAADSNSASSAGTLINLNAATADELQTLSGVGEATAKAIIEDRQNNGQFTCIEDLMRVSGIGEKKFEKIKDRICV